jgi:8-oxo-dGTP pyrophosphatase MutT (NUDIX family)
MRFQKVRERLIFASKWVLVYDDEVVKPDGARGYYTRVAPAVGEGGAHIIPRLPDGRVLLIKSNRYPVSADVWEFPRGALDDGEGFGQAAQRELLEETGLTADKITPLGLLCPDTGILSSRHQVFLAELRAGAEQDLKVPASEGVIEGRFIQPDEVGALLASGDIVDGTALAGLMMLRVTRS